MQGKIIDVTEIKDIFGCDRNTIYGWRRKGVLRLTKVGGKYYAARKDVEKLVEKIIGEPLS